MAEKVDNTFIPKFIQIMYCGMIGMDSILGMNKTNAMNFWKMQIIILKIDKLSILI